MGRGKGTQLQVGVNYLRVSNLRPIVMFKHTFRFEKTFKRPIKRIETIIVALSGLRINLPGSIDVPRDKFENIILLNIKWHSSNKEALRLN